MFTSPSLAIRVRASVAEGMLGWLQPPLLFSTPADQTYFDPTRVQHTTSSPYNLGGGCTVRGTVAGLYKWWVANYLLT